MSESNAPTPQWDEAAPEDAAEPLQFDQAEYTTPAGDRPTCIVCKQPIADEYFELNGQVFCSRCRQGVEASFRGGSRVARAIKALFLGTVAAGVGAVIYYAIIRLTGLNIGLIAVVVGVMVGGAVRRGSGNRGGPFYQVVAILLTYLSIVAMNVPLIVENIFNQAREERAAGNAAELAKGDGAQMRVPGQPGADAVPKRAQDAEGPAQQPQVKIAEPKKAEPGDPADDEGPPPDLSRLLGLIVLMGLFLACPVIEVFQAPIVGPHLWLRLVGSLEDQQAIGPGIQRTVPIGPAGLIGNGPRGG